MRFLIAIRRGLIRRLAGRMPVCLNMTVVNGYVEYGGEHGAIAEGNRFIDRLPAVAAN